MTNETTTQATNTTGRGRPLSEKGRRARNAVRAFVNGTDGETFTARQVAKAKKVNVTAVRNRLNALEREGVVAKVADQEREGRGRPEKLYTVTTSE